MPYDTRQRAERTAKASLLCILATRTAKGKARQYPVLLSCHDSLLCAGFCHCRVAIICHAFNRVSFRAVLFAVRFLCALPCINLPCGGSGQRIIARQSTTIFLIVMGYFSARVLRDRNFLMDAGLL
jgi:hypothetical protein